LLPDYGYRNLVAFDPIAIEVFQKAYPLSVRYAENIEQAVAPSGAVVILTAWKEFRQKRL
jgi:UDPglucose 6-dehydrogenase